MSKTGRISKKVEKKVKEYFDKLDNGSNKDNAKQCNIKPRSNS